MVSSNTGVMVIAAEYTSLVSSEKERTYDEKLNK